MGTEARRGPAPPGTCPEQAAAACHGVPTPPGALSPEHVARGCWEPSWGGFRHCRTGGQEGPGRAQGYLAQRQRGSRRQVPAPPITLERPAGGTFCRKTLSPSVSVLGRRVGGGPVSITVP